MKRTTSLLLAALGFIALSPSHAARKELAYAPVPVENPLKGLVPYRGDVRQKFPHSMEFSYLPLSSLVTGFHTYNWAPLEELLNEVASSSRSDGRLSSRFQNHADFVALSDG